MQIRRGGEGLVRHRQKAAKHQRSTWKPTAMPRPSMSFSTRALCHRGTQNPEQKHWTRPREACCRSVRRRRRQQGERCEVVTGRRGKREAGVTEEGVYHRTINTRPGNGMNNGALSQNKTSPNLNQALSHDNSQLYGAALDTLCIHTAKINTGFRECDSQKQQSPEIEINKALRLVTQVLLLAAGRTLCVCVCVYVCAHACVKRLLDTFPQ